MIAEKITTTIVKGDQKCWRCKEVDGTFLEAEYTWDNRLVRVNGRFCEGCSNTRYLWRKAETPIVIAIGISLVLAIILVAMIAGIR